MQLRAMKYGIRSKSVWLLNKLPGDGIFLFLLFPYESDEYVPILRFSLNEVSLPVLPVC
jgi:hypothetical protein